MRGTCVGATIVCNVCPSFRVRRSTGMTGMSTRSSRPLAFNRRADHRVLAGVAGVFADQHGVDVNVVRLALVLLTLAGGSGIVLYAVGFGWSGEPAAPLDAPHPADLRRTVAFACIVAGAALLIRASGLWIGDAVMVPLAVVGAGIAVLALRAPASEREHGFWAGTNLPAILAGRHTRERLTAGAVLVAAGLLLLGFRHDVSGDVRFGIVATACTLVGVALLFGPWIARSAQEVAEERRRRIRSEERAEMAAHLHDSVLQTLALIQRNANDPRRTITLARRQERELRTWLFGTNEAEATLAAAVRAMAEDVETLHDVRVEAVVVGDRAMDETGHTMLAATREATVNAAKHAGASSVSVYVEVLGDRLEVFVRDRGRGFERTSVAADRKGIRESIEGRVARAVGTSSIESGLGEGTEVHIVLPIHRERTHDTAGPDA